VSETDWNAIEQPVINKGAITNLRLVSQLFTISQLGPLTIKPSK
jgi:hypothetical protein